MFKATLILALVMMLSACNSADKSQSSKILPLYRSCLDHFDTYKEIAKSRYNIELKIRLFSKEEGYPAHPGLIGITELIGNGNNENLQVIENGLEQLCFPKHWATTDNDELGFRIISKDQFPKNLAQGITENYIVMEKDKLTIHFNNTTDEMKNNIKSR